MLRPECVYAKEYAVPKPRPRPVRVKRELERKMVKKIMQKKAAAQTGPRGARGPSGQR